MSHQVAKTALFFSSLFVVDPFHFSVFQPSELIKVLTETKRHSRGFRRLKHKWYETYQKHLPRHCTRRVKRNEDKWWTDAVVNWWMMAQATLTKERIHMWWRHRSFTGVTHFIGLNQTQGLERLWLVVYPCPWVGHRHRHRRCHRYHCCCCCNQEPKKMTNIQR